MKNEPFYSNRHNLHHILNSMNIIHKYLLHPTSSTTSNDHIEVFLLSISIAHESTYKKHEHLCLTYPLGERVSLLVDINHIILFYFSGYSELFSDSIFHKIHLILVYSITDEILHHIQHKIEMGYTASDKN